MLFASRGTTRQRGFAGASGSRGLGLQKSLVQSAFRAIGSHNAHVFEEHCKDSRGTQENLLREILHKNRSTVFGRKHGFSSVRTVQEYRNKVPASKYKDLEPYIARASQGEPNLLTAENPTLFSTTSGTTGARKYIPMTETSRRTKSEVLRLWMYYALRSHPHMLDGQLLAVVSPEIEGYFDSGIPYGAESGHAYKNLPRVVRDLYEIPYEVFLIKDYDVRYYTILRIAAEKNITGIGTCNPSTVCLLARKLREHQEGIIRDIHNGTLGAGIDVPPDIRVSLSRTFKPNPLRAGDLERCLIKRDRLLPMDVWPNLAVVGCWKGGSVGLYLRDFDSLFSPKTAVRDWGYLASELRGSVPMTDEGSGGVLALDSNFYEFVKEEEDGSPNPTYLTADQLRVGEQYYVYVTTMAGLYRYEMNDILQVNGFFGNTPIIEFVQKGKGVSSLTGEKLYESQVCAAVKRSTGDATFPFEFIAATPEWSDPPRYVFLVEETGPSLPDALWTNWGIEVDENLRSLNEEYDTKRRSGRLGNPIVKVVQRGELARYKQRRLAEGAPDAQFKILRLNTDLEFQRDLEVERSILASAELGSPRCPVHHLRIPRLPQNVDNAVVAVGK